MLFSTVSQILVMLDVHKNVYHIAFHAQLEATYNFNQRCLPSNCTTMNVSRVGPTWLDRHGDRVGPTWLDRHGDTVGQ